MVSLPAMAWLLFYPPSCFRGKLPGEHQGGARGDGLFKLKLHKNAEPQRIEVRDDDGTFHELDASQCLARDEMIDGVLYKAGTPVSAAYDLIDSGSGHMVTTLHLGGNGWQQGNVHGLVSTEPLEPGEKYHFDTERSSYYHPTGYARYVACFTAGTRIHTPRGAVAVEALREGDTVTTRDRGAAPLLWVGQRRVLAFGRFAPVAFAPGALGGPEALTLSPLHRVYLEAPWAELAFGATGVLASARHLVDGACVRREPGGWVRYHHLLCPAHELVCANGHWVETLLPGSPMAATEIGGFDELRARFPALYAEGAPAHPTVRPVLRGCEAPIARRLRQHMADRAALPARPACAADVAARAQAA